MTIWALFDSGNGCYLKNANEMGIECLSFGIDIEDKNSHFIELDLSNFSRLFGNDKLFTVLDKYKKPDLIIASPPCESWSVASAMSGGGNACWKTIFSDTIFGQLPITDFAIRKKTEYENQQFIFERQFIKRINGELCAFNLIEIIKKYQPTYWVIENPATSNIWNYISKVLDFNLPYKNKTYYSDYGFSYKMPTIFASNIFLNLSKQGKAPKISWDKVCGYNNRSNIPDELIKQIYIKVIEEDKRRNEKIL